MADDPDSSLPSGRSEQGDTAQDELNVVDTKGGSITTGNVSGTGIAIGPGAQAIVAITEETACNVAGLKNPYLGLRAFTAAERDIFAGRERIVRALVDRLSADDGDRLLFIVGASGSGKSSIARAGLLPSLADQMCDAGYTVQTRIIDHPERMAAASLASLLQDVADNQPFQCVLLLIDQFEELFSQVDPAVCDQILSLLADVTTSNRPSVRIIATMRSDFLPQLVADSRFEAIEQRKVVIRAMSADELHEAIQRPIHVRHPNKRLEPALLAQLAKDAAADAAYLPLLQVTLEDLWRGGELRLSHYPGLTDAIQHRADVVYTYRDYDGLQQERRTPEEQQALLALLLDMVRVSPGEQVHEVRWRRTRSEITHGDPQRERLIADLVTARLLATDRAESEERETVDLVHEALLNSWSRLKEVIAAERDHLRRRERFLLALQEWQVNGQHDDYLLSGVRLAEAEALQQHRDSVLHHGDAAAFMQRSIQRRTEEQQHALAQAQALATAAEAQLVAETRAREEAEARAIEQSTANTRIRRRSQWIAVAALVAMVSAGVAGWFGIAAQQQARVAESRRLAAEANTLLAENLSERALLLAIEAVQRDNNPNTRNAVQDGVVARPYRVTVLVGHTAQINSAVFSPDARRILTISDDDTARLWDADGRPLAVLAGHTDTVTSAVFSPDGQRVLTASKDDTVRLWPVNLVDWLAAAQCRVGRTLTEAEIRTYAVPEPLFFNETTLANRQCPPKYSWE